jgi:hypothetical protein
MDGIGGRVHCAVVLLFWRTLRIGRARHGNDNGKDSRWELCCRRVIKWSILAGARLDGGERQVSIELPAVGGLLVPWSLVVREAAVASQSGTTSALSFIGPLSRSCQRPPFSCPARHSPLQMIDSYPNT